jgi:hypothetical protein
VPAKKRGVSKRASFLAAFAVTASITRAAKAAKIDRALHYRWLAEGGAYPEQFASASDRAAQILEDEAVRRAHEGVVEPNVWKGEFTYKRRQVEVTDADTGEIRKVWQNHGPPIGVRKYSDALLMFLLKGLRPQTYRERVTAELTGKDGGPLEIVTRLNAARNRIAAAKNAE